MANTLKFGNGEWYGKKDTILAYNDENGNFKPLPFDFSRDSSATVVNKDGLIEKVGSGIPRIDYKDDVKGALLLEPQRTNSLPYSEDFSNADWLKTSVTTTLNSEIAPDGTLTACKLDYSASTSARMAESINPAVGTYTFSVYLRSVSGSGDFRIRLQGSSSVDLTVSLTEEWKRFEIESDYDGTVPLLPYIGYYINDSYLQEVYAWGAQIEQGSYATSYISTSGSAVTRLADVCNNGGNEQVINSTEGVFYAEVENSSPSTSTRGWVLQSSLNNGSDLISIRFNSSQLINMYLRANSVTTINVNVSNTYNGFIKIALKYKSGENSLWINGVEVHSNSTTFSFSNSLSNLSNYDGLGNYGYFNIKDTKLYNTALTDNELQKLTQV